LAVHLVVRNEPTVDSAEEQDLLAWASTLIQHEAPFDRYEPIVSATPEAIWVRFETTIDELDNAVHALAKAMTAPADASLAVLRRKRMDHLALGAQSSSAARRHVLELLYGPESALGARPRDSIRRQAAFGPSDLTRVRQNRFAPQSSALVVVGDVSANTVERIADNAFGSWSGSGTPRRVGSQRTPSFPTGVSLVQARSSPAIAIACEAPGLETPGHAPFVILNHLLGALKSSRLMRHIRGKLGYAYSVRSEYAPRREGGTLLIETASDPMKARDALEAILSELDRLVREGPADVEIERARRASLESLRASFETTSGTAANLAFRFEHGLATDYFEALDRAIAGATRDDVTRVARECLRPSRRAIAIAGERAELAAQLQWSKIPYEVASP
jgi:zinc protease